MSHFIAGEWFQGSGNLLSSTDPATGQTIWSADSASATEIERAVDAARSAFESWSDRSIEERMSLLRTFADRVKARKAILSEAISREVGKPRWEANSEVDSVVAKVELSIRAMNERRRDTAAESSGITSATQYKPHGVIAVFGPFNFPAHLPNGHIVPALLAGNTIVFKPSEAAPFVAQLMVECWDAAGIPTGVINLVQGGRETGQLLAANRGIDGIFFTGSFAAGSAINQSLAPDPGRILALEMGGNNPLVVHEIADLDAAAYHIVQSGYITAGQRCTCARRLIVLNDSGANELLDRLIEMTRSIRVGRYTDDPEPFIGPVISDTVAEKVLSAQDELRKRGGNIFVEMRSLGPRRAMLSPGLIDTTEVHERADTEIFGPLLQVIRVRDFDDAIREANNTRYGLAAGLLSDNRALWEKFHKRIRAGVVNWNRPTTGASAALPFGGVGRSGNHRPSGYFAADYCSYPVASMEMATLELPQSLPPGIGISATDSA